MTIKKFDIFLVLLLASCVTASIPLRLQDRTLLIDIQSASLIYPHVKEECKYPNRRLFKRCKDVHTIIKYDLTDKRIREKLIDSGFECHSKLKFNY